MLIMEKGILFKDHMIRSIQSRTKTNTRREFLVDRNREIKQVIEVDKGQWLLKINSRPDQIVTCKYGNPGDKLYVKEAIHFDGKTKHYRANFQDDPKSVKWVSPLFMKRTDARLWLQITDVKLEELHSISEDDAIAEGIERVGPGLWKTYDNSEVATSSPQTSYLSLYASISKYSKEVMELPIYVFSIHFKLI